MTTADGRLLERLAKRVEMWHERHEATGDEKYARLAADADRMYRAARHFFGPCVTPEPYPAGTRWGVSRMTLTEFLLARITEDEENAQDRIEDSMDNGWPHACRVLAECDAKRRIIAEHRNPEGTPWCLRCVEHDGGETPFPCPTLRALALPYADHPDCREEWRL